MNNINCCALNNISYPILRIIITTWFGDLLTKQLIFNLSEREWKQTTGYILSVTHAPPLQVISSYFYLWFVSSLLLHSYLSFKC